LLHIKNYRVIVMIPFVVNISRFFGLYLKNDPQ